jgi:hypothetical protein
MRFMVMVRATKDSETGKMPDRKLIEAMMKFNEELVNAGVMLAGDGLQPSARGGARLKFSRDGRRTIVDGPFPETKELIAGFWMWKVRSREEALEWLRRCPAPFNDQDCEVELRQVFEVEDFGDEITPEMRAKEEQLRETVESRR